MGNYYFDTSALVKYYVFEPGTTWVKSLLDARSDGEWENTIFTSLLSVVEVSAAFAKRQRAGDISKLYAAILARFLKDGRERCVFSRVNNAVIELASDLTGVHPLRAYDAVQLATALLINRFFAKRGLSPITFVSADGSLCKAASDEGLAVENPNDYA